MSAKIPQDIKQKVDSELVEMRAALKLAGLRSQTMSEATVTFIGQDIDSDAPLYRLHYLTQRAVVQDDMTFPWALAFILTCATFGRLVRVNGGIPDDEKRLYVALADSIKTR